MIKQKNIIRTAYALSFLLLVGSLAGCAGNPKKNVPDETGAPSAAGSPTTSDIRQPAEPGQPDSGNEAGFPGSYTVPDGWVKMDEYSTKNKTFYAEKGHENDDLPDNISIEIGTNRYSADEHMQFRDAIVRQLTMQIQGLDAQLTGDGTYTAQDYVLYIFTISEEDVVTKQYYIVGEQQFCLVHLTNFTGSENVDKAAQAIVDSFVWN